MGYGANTVTGQYKTAIIVRQDKYTVTGWDNKVQIQS